MIFAYSFFVGLFVTVVAIAILWRFAHLLGAIDNPGPRKIHASPIPRIGGIAIAFSVLTATALWTPLGDGAAAYLAGAVVIVAIGIWDDIRPLHYLWKILGQSVGISILLFGGFQLSQLSLLGFDLVPEYIAYPAAFIFIFFVTNAFNLFDGLDGLAGGCLVVSIGAISFLALLAGEGSIPTIGFALIGGVLGFLRFNSFPAAIFMGDAGSQFLGFSAGYLALLLVTSANPALNSGLPFLVLGLPLLDTISVALRRLLQKRSPFQGDKQHLHHRLLGIGLTHVQTVTVLYAIQISMVVTAFLTRYQRDTLVLALFTSFGVLLFGVLYSIERTKIVNSSASSGTTVRHRQGSYVITKLMPLASWGQLAAAILLAIFLVAGAVAADTPSRDIALLSTAICVTIIVGVFSESRFRPFLFRLSAYSSSVIVCFLLISGGAQTSIWDNWQVNVYLAILGVLVLVSIALNRENDFRLAPQDLLMALLVVVVPNLEIDRYFNFPIAVFLLQISILFYAIEFVLSARNGLKALVPISGITGLAIVAMTGLV